MTSLHRQPRSTNIREQDGEDGQKVWGLVIFFFFLIPQVTFKNAKNSPPLGREDRADQKVTSFHTSKIQVIFFSFFFFSFIGILK